MSPEPPAIVLASASPRRHELLARLGAPFTVVTPDIDEAPHDGEDPVVYVERLAREKAAAIRETIGAGPVVIAADTTVTLDGRIFGKPDGPDDARAMLVALAGHTHQVHTGVAVGRDGTVVSAVVTTRVHMADADDALIRWYVATGEPLDKAGAYAIQGAGSVLIERLDGSVDATMGLPLRVVRDLAARVGLPLPFSGTSRPPGAV